MKKYRTIIIIVSVLLVMLIAFFIVRTIRQSNAQSQYQTVQVERGTLTATIGATGTVRAMQTAVLAWQTNGMVESVEVSVSDVVQAGDLLASLAKDSLPQSIILAQAELVSAQRNLELLLYSKTPQAQAQLALANAQHAYDTAKANHYTLINRGRADKDTVDNAWAQYVIAQEYVDVAQLTYDRVASYPQDNPIRAQAYSALYAAIQKRDRAYQVWDWYDTQPSDQDVNEAEAKLALAEAQLEDARREWERLKDGPDQVDVDAAQARVTAIQATINMASLRAPFDGVVTEVHPLPGDQVSPGTLGFRIDNLSHMLVDVQVSEVDINNVQIGQPVVLTFDAILAGEYEGQVVAVAPVGNILQGVVNFTVTVELTNADELVKPGMTAAVSIVITELEDVLLVPNRAVRLVDSQRGVYVLRDGELQWVEITLGASSDMMSEIIAGNVQAGDLLVLNPPFDFQSDGHPPFMQR